MSPQQKGEVIRTVKESGEFCLMSGDGTNDVAALKQAHVGVSIMSDATIEEKIVHTQKKLSSLLVNKDIDEAIVAKSPALQVSETPAGQKRWPIGRSEGGACRFAILRSLGRLQTQVREEKRCHVVIESFQERLLEEVNQERPIKLGDASIASPFTCKSTEISKSNSSF